MKAIAVLLVLGAVAVLASDMKVEVHLNDHAGHEHSRFYMNPGDFSCAKVARTHAQDGQLHSKCGFQWSLERKNHQEITVGFHGPKSHLDVAFDLQCADVAHAASAKGAKTLIHDNIAAPGGSHHGHHSGHHVAGGSLHSTHFASGHSSLIETENHPIVTHSSSSSGSHSSSSAHGIVISTLKISDDKFLADLAQYCGHDSESSESSGESSSHESSSDESSSDESSESGGESSSEGSENTSESGSESASESGSESAAESSSFGESTSGSFSAEASASTSDSLPGNSQTASASQTS